MGRVLVDYFLSILSELHHGGPHAGDREAEVLSILSELHLDK